MSEVCSGEQTFVQLRTGFSCINCNGGHSAAFRRCPEMLVHASAHLLRSGNYISFSVALQRARVELLGGPFYPSRPDSETLNPSLTGAGLSTEPR